MVKVVDLLARVVATGLGSGYSPFAPGTAGSVVGLLLFWPLAGSRLPSQIAMCVVSSSSGRSRPRRSRGGSASKDPGIVVVDEVLGQWLTLLALPFTPAIVLVGLPPLPRDRHREALTGRGELEHLPGGWGIMADDVAAGVYANLLLRVGLLVWPCRRVRAEILAVGSELLCPLRSDTNALWITERLLEVGVEVGARTTVADDLRSSSPRSATALSRSDVVISTGGLGPTEDDLTREARPPRSAAPFAATRWSWRRSRRGSPATSGTMAPTNEKQADVIEGADVLLNPRGTRPGQASRTATASSFCCRARRPR